MPQEQSQRRFARVNLLPLFFIATLLLVGAGVYFFTQRLQIRKIEISSTEPERKILGIENYYQSNLYVLSEEDFKKTLYEANPGLRNISIKKVYPDGLNITVEFDKGISALIVDQGYFVLAPNARIISKTKQKPAQLPEIHYYQKLHYTSYQTGDLIDLKDIVTALYFVKKMNEMGLKTSSIDINGFNMIRLQLENKMVFFTTEKSVQEQDYQLEILIRQFKVQGRDFKTLDFRFDKPIVTLQ